MPKISIDPELCTKCGTCVENCPVNIFNQEEEDTIPCIKNPENCVLCGECVSNCPANAVKHEEFD
jgi:NAD-dependent dihydropyrimidine dehydrogenase PreA subunit